MARQGSLEAAVSTALTTLDAQPVDGAAAALAVTYARTVDRGGDLEKLGPLLLTALESLHMTPRARAAAVKGDRANDAASPLDELRVRRASRVADAKAVDATAT